MPHKDWYGQSIIVLILCFLSCSALIVAYDDILTVRHPAETAVARAHRTLTFTVDYRTAEVRATGPLHPAVILTNRGASAAIVEATTYDASGIETQAGFIMGCPISIPAGASTTIPLAGTDGLTTGEYALKLSSNEPITADLIYQEQTAPLSPDGTSLPDENTQLVLREG